MQNRKALKPGFYTSGRHISQVTMIVTGTQEQLCTEPIANRFRGLMG